MEGHLLSDHVHVMMSIPPKAAIDVERLADFSLDPLNPLDLIPKRVILTK